MSDATTSALEWPDPPLLIGGGSTLLAVGIDGTYARACLLEDILGSYRLAAWLTLPRQGARHLGDEVAALCRQLGSRLGRRLWDDAHQRPLLTSADPTRYPPVAQLTVTLSPRPPLRVWVVALSAGYSLEAALLAVTAAPAEVIGHTLLTVDGDLGALAATLRAMRPDALLLVGGYDQAKATAQPALTALVGVVVGALARLPARARPSVIYAGNQGAATHVQTQFAQAGGAFTAVPNVMPAPNQLRQDAAAAALDALYWQRCRQLDGFATLKQWHTSPAAVTSLEASFARLVQTWLALHQLRDLHGIYTGGPRRLHVWANEASPDVTVLYADAQTPVRLPAGWPVAGLLSGVWSAKIALPAGVQWWDRSGLAPLVASLAPVAPAAAVQTLRHDLLLPVRSMSA